MNLTSTGRHAPRPPAVSGRALARVVTLLVVVSFSVVGLAAPSMAHHNTITGTVACKIGGGWSVTWRVVNSEQRSETIVASNRSSAVPVGTVLGPWATRVSTETVTARPTAPLTLTLTGRWTNGVSATNSGSIPVAAFSDECVRQEVPSPQVPVVDDCGAGNAHYGTVPAGPWTSVVHADGSITLTAQAGYVFPDGQTAVTYPVPVDTAQPCPTPAEVLPAEVRVVRGQATRIDKCGRAGDLYKVAQRAGVRYVVRGKVVREGTWLRARQRRVVVRAQASGQSFELTGKRVWRFTFSQRPCAPAPHVLPATGS